MTQPNFGANPLVEAMEGHRAHREQIRENSSRQAWSWGSVSTHGYGAIQHATVVPFNCTFIDMPKIATGFSMDGDTLIDGAFPTVTAGVWKWQQDYREFYVGAYVFFVITGDAGYDLIHDFTFSGIALKDLPDHLVATL